MVEIGTIKPLTDETALEWARLSCWSISEALWLLNGFSPEPTNAKERMPEFPSRGFDAQVLYAAIDAKDLIPLGEDKNGASVFRPDDVIRVAKAANVGAWEFLEVAFAAAAKDENSTKSAPHQDEQLADLATLERKPGRYTLPEAAKKIAQFTGGGRKQILEALIFSALHGELTVFRTGQGNPLKPKLKYDAHFSEALWNDLNEWMLQQKIQCDFKFPNPTESASPGAEQGPKGEAKSSRTIHTIKNRTSILDAEITKAKENASNPQDHHSVWSALKGLALDEHGAFTGTAEGDSLEYESDGKKIMFTKGALRKRMNRAR